jgi:hypothetical protein
MSVPPFDSTTYSTYTQPPNPSWTYGQKIDTTPAGKEWVAGESAGWKVYDTAETDKTYVLLDLLFSRNRDHDQQRYLQALDLRHRTTPYCVRVHNQ